MIKNQATVLTLYVIDTSDSGKPKTGDVANLSFFVTKDGGTTIAIAGSLVEEDAVNAKGLYRVALTAGETNADHLLYSGKSSTTDIEVIPKTVDTDRGLNTAIKAKTDLLAFTAGNVHSHTKVEDNIDFGATKKTSINAEVKDVVTVDNSAEPTSVPPKDAPISEKIDFIYAYLRNKKLTTDTTETLRNDADSADIASAALADDATTTTKNKMT